MDKKGILYVGSGVSGGEEGARYGPSLMPGGNAAAWPYIKDIFQVWDEIISMFRLITHNYNEQDQDQNNRFIIIEHLCAM